VVSLPKAVSAECPGTVQSSFVSRYTRRGDDGTTDLLFGGRVGKDATGPEACGAIDEAVSALGVARAAAGEHLAAALLEVQRELFVLGAELATAAPNRGRLQPRLSLVVTEMVARLEAGIDAASAEVKSVGGFVVPGGNPASAAVDLARTAVRRAERRAVAHLKAAGITGSLLVPYLNRLSDYLFVMARTAEGGGTPVRVEEG
jgi:cob(I)alamin adenosyltransferase